jgi:DNA-binding MarR family transcriptional regulator
VHPPGQPTGEIVKSNADRQTKAGERHDPKDPSPGRRRPRGSSARARHLDLGGLDQLTGYVVRRAQVWIFQDFKRRLRDFDITPAQFAVVKVVAANPGVAQARVAEVLGIERARLVEMLDRLGRRGLVVRSRSPSDRRTHALQLTHDGAALLERLQPCLAAHEQNVVARIGAEDKTTLLRILRPLLR